MILIISFAVLFIGSSTALWYFLSEKILPRLVTVPDHVITERLEERSARFHLFLLNFKTFYREKHYIEFFWRLLGKFLRKLHVFVMKIDNGIVAILDRIRANGGGTREEPEGTMYAGDNSHEVGVPTSKNSRVINIKEMRLRKKEE